MTPFAVIVRAALDELDDSPGNDYWTIRDANKLTESILAHMIAFGLARAEEDDRFEEAAGWAS